MAASKMTASVEGYQCQFISEVSDDLLCGICRLVAREPHITSCCGTEFCKSCISQVLDASKSCPFCSEADSAIFPDKRDQKKILALRVCCTMKERGCEWVGKLEDLQAHLLVDTNDCQYVDIQCPDKCGESVPRHQLPSHLADSCLNRDYFCKYCNLKSTYRIICNEHTSKCPHYPVQCPNACSVGAFERGDLEDHIKVCHLQEVSCELSHAGCKETFLREDEDRHMEENTQKHLLLMSAMSQRMCREFEQKLQEQREEKEREIAKVKQELREKERKFGILEQALAEKEDAIRTAKQEQEAHLTQEREKTDRALREKDAQLQTLEEQCRQNKREIESLKESNNERVGEPLAYQFGLTSFASLGLCPSPSISPACFTVTNYSKLARENGCHVGPYLHTANNGYYVYFKVWPNGYGLAKGSYVSVGLYSKSSKLDKKLEWPAEVTFTLQLLNQHRDLGHVTETKRCKWEKPNGTNYICYWTQFASHDGLGWNGSRGTQFLKNDCLVFRIVEVNTQQ